MQKSNESHVNDFNFLSGLTQGEGANRNLAGSNLLTHILPGLVKNARANQDMATGAQLLGSLAQNFPAIRDIPGMNMLTTNRALTAPVGGLGAKAPTNRNFGAALDQVTPIMPSQNLFYLSCFSLRNHL